MFEPSRLALMHLIDAYSQIVPLRRRATQSARSPQPTPSSIKPVSKQEGAS